MREPENGHALGHFRYAKYCEDQAASYDCRLQYTALPSEEQKKQMGDFIKKKYGAGDIKWVMAEDKALIGGFILQVDGKRI